MFSSVSASTPDSSVASAIFTCCSSLCNSICIVELASFSYKTAPIVLSSSFSMTNKPSYSSDSTACLPASSVSLKGTNDTSLFSLIFTTGSNASLECATTMTSSALSSTKNKVMIWSILDTTAINIRTINVVIINDFDFNFDK